MNVIAVLPTGATNAELDLARESELALALTDVGCDSQVGYGVSSLLAELVAEYAIEYMDQIMAWSVTLDRVVGRLPAIQGWGGGGANLP